jgi:mannose-6-phosphate isomerase
MGRRLKPQAAAMLDWATGAALPLWADVGFDREHERFEERLTLAAECLPDIPIRLISQARQIHVYALAAKRGWYPGAAALAEKAFASMVRDFHATGGQDGWAFSIRRDGRVADPRRDLYAHAFVLLAIASCVEATGRREGLALADRTLTFVDRHMAAPLGCGFVEQLPATAGLRRQNPHMHLFEGLLALWECSGEARYLARAAALFDLFASRFFRADPGVVGEYFTAALEPAEGVAGELVEPGHHYEWIWLLRRFERAGGARVQRYADALYSHADRYGFDGAGMVVDEVLVDGSHHSRSHRVWPIAEAIRANLVEARAGRARSAGKAASLVGVLRERFLATTPRGGWFDRLDANGARIGEFMPASTLYHLAGAIDELGQFALSATTPAMSVLET